MALCTFEEGKSEGMQFALYDKAGETIAEGYFSNIRVDRRTLPNGWFAYDIREDDATGDAGTIEDGYVIVNHFGTFLTQTKLELPQEPYVSGGKRWANLGDSPTDDYDYSFI